VAVVKSNESPALESNEAVVEKIVARIERDLTGQGSVRAVGPLTPHRFSFTFTVSIETAGGRRDLFVKIPKQDLAEGFPRVFPFTERDRSLARDEAASLRFLGERWRSDDLHIRWVRLAAEIPEYNAIVTERVFAPEAFTLYRRLDLSRRLGFRGNAGRLRNAMSRFGTALRRFHQLDSRPAVFRLAAELPKLERYAKEIEAKTRSALPHRVVKLLALEQPGEIEGLEVTTLKGIDVRNFLADDPDGITLLDPGKTKRNFREADVARFILTYRILFWGSPSLLLTGPPDARAERAFLDAYFGTEPPNARLLEFYTIKEQLKHWHTALHSLERRSWPGVVKNRVERWYVKSFYSAQLETSIRALTQPGRRSIHLPERV
jgi:hypothetical protein